MLPEFIDIVRQAGDTIINAQSAVPADVATVIRNAHLGDHDAIRTIAGYYRNGSPGFMKDNMLSKHWLQLGAMYGDAKAALLLATRLYSDETSLSAAAWADLAVKRYKDESDSPENAWPSVWRQAAPLFSGKSVIVNVKGWPFAIWENPWTSCNGGSEKKRRKNEFRICLCSMRTRAGTAGNTDRHCKGRPRVFRGLFASTPC